MPSPGIRVIVCVIDEEGWERVTTGEGATPNARIGKARRVIDITPHDAATRLHRASAFRVAVCRSMTKAASLVLPPTALRVHANGLEHRVLEWKASGLPRADASTGTVFLLHGYMDAAGTWDRVAPALADDGFRVLAPDLRGFGSGNR